jgi:hypothetical protein
MIAIDQTDSFLDERWVACLAPGGILKHYRPQRSAK